MEEPLKCTQMYRVQGVSVGYENAKDVSMRPLLQLGKRNSPPEEDGQLWKETGKKCSATLNSPSSAFHKLKLWESAGVPAT